MNFTIITIFHNKSSKITSIKPQISTKGKIEVNDYPPATGVEFLLSLWPAYRNMMLTLQRLDFN